jgi:hypothetical protein
MKLEEQTKSSSFHAAKEFHNTNQCIASNKQLRATAYAPLAHT